MDGWSSFADDKKITDNWRQFLGESAGIDSVRYPDSLTNMLTPLVNQGILTHEEKQELLDLMLRGADEDEVVLEALGEPQRDIRTFSDTTTNALNDLIASFGLKPADRKRLEGTFIKWARLNTVNFAPVEPNVGLDPSELPPPATPEPTRMPLPPSRVGPPIDDEEEVTTITPDPEPEPDPESTEISVDKAECDELFDVKDPAIQKLLDQAEADNTIRGKVAEIGRDFSFSMDAVTLSLLGVALIPAAQPVATVAVGTGYASMVGSAVAVTADLLNGEWKQAALDAIGLIPTLGGAAGKSGKTAASKTAEKTAAKAGEKAAAEAAQGAGTAAAKQAAMQSARGAIKAFQKAGAAVTGGIAKAEGAIAARLVKLGVEEGLSSALAKTIIHSSKAKLQEKINSMLGDAPPRSAFETDEAHKAALRKYYDERKATSAKIYANCFSDTDSEITKSVKQFLDQIHDWIDDVPRWLGTAIEWGMDTYGTLTGKDLPTSSPPVSESLITESQYNRWQTIAGINKRVK